MVDYRVQPGDRFGKLVALTEGRTSRDSILCQCDCGADPAERRAGNLLGPHGHRTTSCGCEQARRQAAGNPKHGLRHHPLYRTWMDMQRRCYSKTRKEYAGYGGRGITVCDRWRGPDGFVNFLQDMGPRPDSLSLNRVDNDGPYSPENCEWADSFTQMRNRRPQAGNPYMVKLQAEVASLRAENEILRRRVAELEDSEIAPLGAKLTVTLPA